jgi:plastocyanin
MRKSLSRWLAATMVIASMAVGGSASAHTASGSAQGLNPRGIVIDNDAYYPNSLRVMPGQMIAVTNAEGEDHSLTAKDGAFDTGIFDSGTLYVTAPKTVGRYKYSCLVHGPTVMKGVLIVVSP